MEKTTKPTICLVMIVKNESAVIRRCLDSVAKYINYWVGSYILRQIFHKMMSGKAV
jgi:hypothetical protein